MKKIISVAILVCITMALSSQPKGNLTYLKLFVINENSDLLMVRFKGIWEPIGGTYNSKLPIVDYVKKKVEVCNVECGDVRLRGLFSVYYGKTSLPYAYHYYTIEYKGGDIIPPSDCDSVAWFSADQVMDKIEFKDMGRVFEKIQGNDDLWSGSWYILKNPDTNERKIEYKQDFFKLN